MNLTKLEQETIILFNEDEKTAEVCTCNKALQRKLKTLSHERPYEVKIIASDSTDSITFEVPKNYIKVTPPKRMNYTEEQRQSISDRFKKTRENADKN